MDFTQAIAAHAEWKVKLRLYLGGQGDLDPAVIAQDNQCALGKWIYGEGQAFAHLPEFEELRQHHASFHTCASQVVQKIDAGNQDGAAEDLEPNGEFAALSSEISMGLMRLKRHVSEAPDVFEAS